MTRTARHGITKRTLARAAAAERAGARIAATTDSFNNFNINLGLGTNNALSGGTYGFNPITRIRTLLEFMYRGSWLARVAIDQVAKDMTRGGVDLHTDADPEDVQRLENKMRRLGVWGSTGEVIKWGRLYGGAMGYIQIDGADPAQPLRVEAVGRGAFQGILVLDRWMLEPLLNKLVPSGPDAGLPEFYRVTSDAPGLRGQTFHQSRAMRVVGIELPYWQRIMENYWGLSVFEPLYDRMVAFDSATMGAAQLAYKAHVRTLRVKGYRQIQATGGPLAQGFAKQMEILRRFQSVEGLSVIDAEDEMTVQQTSAMSGIADIMLQLGQQISGGLQTPLTKLFGQAPAGLNSTGEGDTRNYYDGIKQEQEHSLLNPMHLIYRVCAASEGVDLGDDFDLDFRPLWQMTEDEMSTIEERSTRSVLAVGESGLVSDQVVLRELKSRGRNTNTWQTISEEDIERADDEPAPEPAPGEIVGPGGEPTGQEIKPGGDLKHLLGGRDASMEEWKVKERKKEIVWLKKELAKPVWTSLMSREDAVARLKYLESTSAKDAAAPTHFQGLPITIEHRRGEQRWDGAPRMPCDYGFIDGVGSAEGDEEWMDCMVGAQADAPYAYVLDQYRGTDFDEHKVMLGFPSMVAARRAHGQAYAGTEYKAHAGAQMDMAQLRDWMSRPRNVRRPAMIADRNVRRIA